ncbi:hypothetical protein, variant 1 [Aphanomyces astaci]|uniref:F-box domain-containing protein n=1 Tax=Aphanomyces astaci TaxID=112090 RepID=W4FKM7_APHAT|nr:hypothetical protein, variant 1 [Aphanomyces astaci]ETV67273.1 hypothetical protein, variant 1 [Aphanomyces astaci]|eukprot:XP_009843261.1 hypothetical protein, variant 1 [Aphanomyces astaci]
MHTLPRDALLHALEYLEPMELRAMALVSRWHNSLQQHGALWEALFRHRWNHANFFMDPCMRIQLSPALRAAYPRSSDAFRFLTHCVDRVPSFADICLTNTHATASTTNHRIEPVAYDNGQVVTMALAKGGVGGNRCVRANVPFEMTPRVAVFQTTDRTWFVDVVYDGYFEISIADPINPMRDDATLDMCIAIGVASPDFEVVDQQPGTLVPPAATSSHAESRMGRQFVRVPQRRRSFLYQWPATPVRRDLWHARYDWLRHPARHDHPRLDIVLYQEWPAARRHVSLSP